MHSAGTGTIRGDFALMVGRNICHGSDSVENAEKEIKLSVSLPFHPLPLTSFVSWFPGGVIQYEDIKASMIYE